MPGHCDNSQVQVGNSMVDMYAKCGKFDEAMEIFATLSHESRVSWMAMIPGYAQK